MFGVSLVRSLVDAVIIAITVVVVAVPEGLPLAVTLSLAYSVGQMKKENNLVRRLEAAETMGGATEICTDKTGTLTKNLMTVTEFYCEGAMHSAMDNVDLETENIIMIGSSVNSTSHLLRNKQTGEIQRIGNQTECALLDFVNYTLKN